MRKRIVFLLTVLCLGIHVFAQRYTVVDAKSEIGFTIKNFGLSVDGTFKDLKGEILFDENNLAAAKFNASVNTSTINTDNTARDNHLRKEEYFNVEKYPTINFTSTEISKGNTPGIFLVKGNLTIKGVTQPITVNCKAEKQADGYLFSGDFTINRRDFGVGGNSLILSDKVKVSLTVVAVK